MRVDPLASLSVTLSGLLRASRGQNAPAPFQPDGGATQPAAPNMTAGAVTGSLAMLVTMAAQDPARGRAAAIRRAEGGLKALDRLRHAQLAGTLTLPELQELAAWASTAEDEPGELQPLLREIELRILVELARLGA